MQPRRRDRAIPVGLALAAYVLALVQRPGTVVADTKVDLYVHPGSFLADVASAWTDTGQLGHVFGGQYGGYLWPMAPWFALGDVLGLPVWLVHRLWLGTLLAVAAWGVVRLLDALGGERRRGVLHVAAAVLYVLNPYVAVYANRTSVALLAYAALPWLLLAVHHGLRAPRSWRWPALFALALTCTGGGVNAATVGWILLGPLLLGAYELWVLGVDRGALRPLLVRLVPLTALANVWWVVPLVVHARYGLNFLPFTEQPGTIWQTTSITESLRLTGFWTSYIGVGFGGELRPFASHADVLLFDPPVVVAGLLVPGLVLLAFAWTRRWAYGPLFLALALCGLLVMVAGFPEGTPLRRALTFTYNHVPSVQFLRTTYKAGPLLALGLAGLGGGAFALAWRAAAPRSAALRAALVAAALGLVAVAAWPLTTGTASERQLAFDVPPWWRSAAAAVDRLPGDERALVLPGQLFAYYDWGGTIDPMLPALASRPVAERSIVPYSDLRAIDLQWAVDDLVSQERMLPGQLPPLVDLLGAGAVVTGADGDRSRSGEVGAAEAADALRTGFGASAAAAGATPGPAARSFGPDRRELPAAGRVRPAAALPRVRMRRTATGGLVRLLPRDAETVVDGGGQGIAQLAAFGGLDPAAPLAYAADVPPAEIRRAASVVVTDSNRRQAFVAARLRGNRGPVLAPDQDVSQDGTMLDPFDAGPDAETVQRLTGVRSVSAPASPQVTQFPEHRPFAAIDGDPETAWLADRALARDRHHVDVALDAPRAVGAIEVLPYSDGRGRVRRIAVNGREVAVRDGWNRIPVAGRVSRVSVRIVDVSQPRRLSGGAGGIAEIRIPGVRARETLRPPVLAERALRGTTPRSLTYLLSRTTVDAPLREGGPPAGPFQSYLLRDRVDPEPQLARTITPPAAARWTLTAWTRVDPAAPEDAIDRLVGAHGPGAASPPRLSRSRRRPLAAATPRIRSSGAYEGIPGLRGSKAFDGRRDTAWIGAWRGRAELSVVLPRSAAVRRLRLVAPRAVVRRPTRVAVGVDGVGAPAVAVGPDGEVVLPRALRGRRLALTVEDARFPAGTPGRERLRRAVGIAEVQGVPGARIVLPRRGGLRGGCGDARLRTAAGTVALAPRGSIEALERGDPLAAGSCGAVRLPAGQQDLRGASGLLKIDHLRLASAAKPVIAPAPAGRVLDPGEPGRGSRDGIRLDVRRPSWLVVGESYDPGWRATCDGKDIGPPTPLQGYANAWRVEPGCREVDASFAPNRLLPPAYLISLLAALVCLALLLRRRRASPVTAPNVCETPPGWGLADVRGPRETRRWPLVRALTAGVVAGAALGFVFALRAGVVLGPATAFVLWRGVTARQAALAGGALLVVVVPVLYLAIPVDDPGGYNTNLAVQRIAAHWVGVAAVFLLSTAMVRAAAARRSGPSPPRSG